jgi:hypothetical protein
MAGGKDGGRRGGEGAERRRNGGKEAKIGEADTEGEGGERGQRCPTP